MGLGLKSWKKPPLSLGPSGTPGVPHVFPVETVERWRNEVLMEEGSGRTGQEGTHPRSLSPVPCPGPSPATRPPSPPPEERGWVSKLPLPLDLPDPLRESDASRYP